MLKLGTASRRRANVVERLEDLVRIELEDRFERLSDEWFLESCLKLLLIFQNIFDSKLEAYLQAFDVFRLLREILQTFRDNVAHLRKLEPLAKFLERIVCLKRILPSHVTIEVPLPWCLD